MSKNTIDMERAISKIKNIEVVVEKILLNFPETRDSDKILVLKVWANQNPSLRDPNTSFRSFADDYISGKYCDSESITRARRKLQERIPELRGKKWFDRHDQATEVRRNINK